MSQVFFQRFQPVALSNTRTILVWILSNISCQSAALADDEPLLPPSGSISVLRFLWSPFALSRIRLPWKKTSFLMFLLGLKHHSFSCSLCSILSCCLFIFRDLFIKSVLWVFFNGTASNFCPLQKTRCQLFLA